MQTQSVQILVSCIVYIASRIMLHLVDILKDILNLCWLSVPVYTHWLHFTVSLTVVCWIPCERHIHWAFWILCELWYINYLQVIEHAVYPRLLNLEYPIDGTCTEHHFILGCYTLAVMCKMHILNTHHCIPFSHDTLVISVLKFSRDNCGHMWHGNLLQRDLSGRCSSSPPEVFICNWDANWCYCTSRIPDFPLHKFAISALCFQGGHFCELLFQT